MIEKNKLGMALFLFAEANFFLILILAYIYYHTQAANSSTARGVLDPLRTGIFTVCLIASSLTVAQAGKSIRVNNRTGLRAWLLATLVLGAVFLFGQLGEYARLFNQNVTISRDLFGTTFFTLTGFHGLHVLAGLIALGVIAILAFASDMQHAPSRAVEVVSLYWHFVDVVWIIIFGIVYLWILL